MKLQVSAPDSYLVERYLEEIARTYDIQWRSNLIDHPEDQVDDFMDGEEDTDDENNSDGDGSGGQAEVTKLKTDHQNFSPQTVICYSYFHLYKTLMRSNSLHSTFPKFLQIHL